MHKQIRLSLIVIGMLLACTATLFGQKAGKLTLNELFSTRVEAAQKQIVGVAEAMPEDKYDFVPSQGDYKGVRNFAEQIHHISTGNYYFGSAILGEKSPLSEADMKNETKKSKAELIQELKESFAYLDKALKSITAENMLEVKAAAHGTPTRMGAAIGAFAHISDIYGQCVEYLRLNGIVPPASRK